MISVQEASEIVLSNPGNFGTENVPLSKALNRTLAEEVYTDRPFPPFDKAMMDGVALNFASWDKGIRNFKIESAQFAGAPRIILVNPDACIEVMTGAIIPKGTDVVVPVESIDIVDGFAKINSSEVSPFQHITKKGDDKKQNELLLEIGVTITPAEIASLATVGKCEVLVNRLPKIAIISTGDELVEIDQNPKPFQIRKSNVLALEASLLEEGVQSELFHLNDTKEEIHSKLSEVLNAFDAVIMSGGVSKGKKDFVPEVLEELGVEKLFHRVRQRPGKPFWFGKNENGIKVFALPGNPVSTFMCYYRYVKPWLLKSLNKEEVIEWAELTDDFKFDRDLTLFLQVEVIHEVGHYKARQCQGKGSGDLANLNHADGFLELPDGKTKFLKGEKYPLIRYRY